MIGVCLTLSTSYSEQQWDFVLSNFAADSLFLMDGPEPTGKLLKEATRIASVDQLPGEIPLVVMTPLNARYMKGETSLADFVHPADAIYLFGPDNLHLSQASLGVRKPDHKVYVPTDSNVEMYSWTAYAVTAWSRKHG